MTAAEQQIPGDSTMTDTAQGRSAVDQAKVEEIISRMDRAHETPMFHRIVALVAAGMLMDSIDVYIGSAVASSALSTHWSTVAQNSTFMSAGFLGLLVGSLLAGFVGDLKGRRVAYQINLLLFGGFTFLGAFAPNMAILSLCRLGAGLGLGAEIVTGFAMVNEFAPMNRRGHWCAIVSLVANCGVPIAMLLCAFIIPRWSWRPLFVGIGVVAAVIWWLRRDIPESPRWLAVHGRYDEADAIVKQLEANGSEPEAAAAKTNTDSTRNAGGRSLGICLLVAIVAVSATNVCSYAFTSWVPTILVKRGINLSSSLTTSTLMMLGAPVGCLIGSLLIDRIGRKRTIVPAFLFTGVFGMLYAFQSSTTGAIIVGFLLMMCLYVLMASVVAVYAPELFATKVRFRCVGVANAIAKLLNVLMPMVVGWMLVTLGATSIFVSISVIAIASMLIVGFFGVETAQKSVG
ncbi:MULTISPECIES: MFS transporter [Bifidobacterium]|uniref:Metabolite transport protein n=1 Tax=Bifidobacterium reuteri DSM 23975 TaxID=1437610 RepID=A0A087CP02_9BIFI|nr:MULTISPECIES: MFS transporter [Bifidobacterium]KFI85002.1 metabolite transport protein [Bifidobacterium reuteri DSM 23975]TPF77410.1 MFS transporter permease [Bifidobacterium sp. UTCIF-1]TPF79407.1 MFS transporter permease [Bifidobacterium sp. UTCIF-24]TPF81388.1 MFS transporter permease [Bifidobacterium sp. UTCIF-3]TPF83506.1 MFS transporter permease [Bifidobacterium sp. UTCIF-36]